MRRGSVYIVALVISFTLCITSVSAFTNQNLHWGISVNQRFDYNVYYEFVMYDEYGYMSSDVNKSTHDRVYHIVESLPMIANDIDNLTDIPTITSPESSCYFENGTRMEHGYLWEVYPVGNWNLIIDLWLDYYDSNEMQIVDTQELVGQNFSSSEAGYSLIIYNKINGVLHTYQSVYSTEFTYSNFTIALIPPVETPAIYIPLAIGAAGSILIAYFIIDRHGKKNVNL
ncbi:MAG: hypothetical protein RTV31_00675 [Candidatus Thorarchaeota archaeon]